MIEIKIQKATIENLRDIQNLNLKLFEKEYKEYDKLLNCNWTFSEEGTQYFKDKILQKNNCSLVAVEKDKVVGYLVGGVTKGETYRNLPKMAELEDTFVLEEYRNLGIGTKLYEEFVKWCKSNGVKIITVQATAENNKAINFYRKNGFKDYTLVLEHKLSNTS